MFEGFRPETVDFLWGIRMNNNRDWFQSHKQDYTQYLYEPMKELGRYFAESYRDMPQLRVKVSRIYKDARMHPAVPYKEGLWVCIRRDDRWWAESPCQFLDISPEGVSYGLILWQPKTQAMVDFREAIARQPEAFLSLIQKTQADTGCPVTAAQYKRPKPCPDPRLEPFYLWKGAISCVREEPFGEATFSPDLAPRALEMLHQLDPLTQYLSQFGD